MSSNRLHGMRITANRRPSLQSIARLATGAFLFLFPFEQILSVFAGTDTELKPYRIALFAAMIPCFLCRGTVLRRASAARILYLLISPYVLGVAMAAIWTIEGSDFFGDTVHQITLFVICILAVYCILVAGQNEKDILFLLNALTLGVVASVVVWLFALDTGSYLYRASGLMRNPNHFAALLSIATIILLSRCVRTETSNLANIFALGTALICIIALIWSGSRTGIIVSIAGFGYLLLLQLSSASNRLRKIGFFAIIIGFGLSFLLPLFARNIFADSLLDRYSLEAAAGGSGRLDLWRAGFEAASDYFFVGIGLGQFRHQSIDYVNSLNFEAYKVLYVYSLGLHSEYVTLFVECGIFGLIIYLLGIGGLFQALNRKIRRDGSKATTTVLLKVMLFMNLAFAASQDSYIFPLYWIILALALSAISGEYTDKPMVRQQGTTRVRRR